MFWSSNENSSTHLQVFEEGTTSRGRMKTTARDVVRLFYKDDLYPDLDFCHNSAQLEELVADNVKKLLKDSRFHIGLKLDAQVNPLLCHSFCIAHDCTLGPY